MARFQTRVAGNTRKFRIEVSEPEPGRVLMEHDARAGVTTTFTTMPEGGGSQSRVEIASEQIVAGGLQGLLDRLFSPPVLRRIYRAELQQLAAVLAADQVAGQG